MLQIILNSSSIAKVIKYKKIVARQPLISKVKIQNQESWFVFFTLKTVFDNQNQAAFHLDRLSEQNHKAQGLEYVVRTAAKDDYISKCESRTLHFGESIT